MPNPKAKEMINSARILFILNPNNLKILLPSEVKTKDEIKKNKRLNRIDSGYIKNCLSFGPFYYNI
jgi:hypothetical protein